MRAESAEAPGGGNVLLLAGGLLLALALGLLAVRFYDSQTGPAPDVVQTADPYAATVGVIAFWEQRINENPGDFIAYNRLAQGYIQRARETGDVSDYGRADAAVNASLAELAAENNYTAAVLQASLHNIKHDFELGRIAAERAIAINPSDDYGYAVLGDAQIALGQYDAALATYNRMVDDAPSLASFSRLAHIHELRGDRQEAEAAWQNALSLDSGRRLENTAWARVQFGDFYFGQGDIEAAVEQYAASLGAVPEYVHSLASQARIRAARGDYEEAIVLYEGVVARQPAPEYVIALGDAYQATGDQAAANRRYALVSAIDGLYKANGVKTDLQMAVFFADHDIRLEEAVLQARNVYEKQPESIYAADGLAWALYKRGKLDEASTLSQQALRLGTRDAMLLFHAGMISNAAGRYDEARDYLDQALKINAQFSVLYAEQAARTLGELQAMVKN